MKNDEEYRKSRLILRIDFAINAINTHGIKLKMTNELNTLSDIRQDIECSNLKYRELVEKWFNYGVVNDIENKIRVLVSTYEVCLSPVPNRLKSNLDF